MALIKRNDVNQIFADQAPAQDQPANFRNYPRGWDEARKKDGKPEIPQFNFLQQRTDQNFLYIHQQGAALPFHSSIEYAEGAVVLKDGVLSQKKGSIWIVVGGGGISTIKSVAELIAIKNPQDGQTVYVKDVDSTYEFRNGDWRFAGSNVITIRIDQFGGKTYQEDPSFDNADIIDKMCESIYSIYKKRENLTSSEIQTAINATKPHIIELNGLYRTTRPFHLPPNTSILQCFEGYFSQNPKVGVFYDTSNLNTYALSPFLYKRDTEEDNYYVNTDVDFMPSGFDFDNGVCIMAGVRQQLINTFVLTKRGVTLAYRLVGWAGCYAENIGCGENQSTWARNPKVALLIASAWGARINGINTLSTHQGFVSYNANGGLVVSGMYTNQSANSDYAKNNSLIKPVFKPEEFTSTGSTGVMQMGEGSFNSPICEGWYHAHVGASRVSVNEPHYERIDGYNFYLINSEADINLKGVTAIDSKSLFYLKDYRDFGREVKVRGLLSMGGNLVTGENSDPSLILDVLRPHTFIQFWGWGDINLIKSVENKWGVNTIYVNPASGDDSRVGLRDVNPLRSLTHAKKLADLFSIKNINIMGEMSVDAGTKIPNNIVFYGARLNLLGSMHIADEGVFDISFRNTAVASTTSAPVLLSLGQKNNGHLGFTADIDAQNSTLIQASNVFDVDVSIRNSSTKLAIIAYSQLYNPSAVGWSVHTDNYSVTYNNDGGAYFKSISPSVGIGSIEITSETLAANNSKIYDIPVKVANADLFAVAKHSVYTEGLVYTASVKSRGVVSVVISNRTSAPISIPSGLITAKCNQ